MGWLRMFAMGNVGQQLDISDQQKALGQLRDQLRAQAGQVKQVDEQLVELWSENLDLKLYVAAIFRLLVAKKLVTPEELRALVDAVDAEDGKSDGVFRGDVLPKGPT